MAGWFQQRRERKRFEEATRAHRTELEAWEADHDKAEQFLYEAQHLPSREKVEGLVLTPNEGLFLGAEGAALGEERRSGLTLIDSGTVFITNKRVVFQGMKQTRECAFSKLIGFQHHDAGATTFSVSNRQKATVISYGPEAMPMFRFRLDLALANYQGTVNELVEQLQRSLDELDAQRPVPPQPAQLPTE
jgi:hypothetical protein